MPKIIKNDMTETWTINGDSKTWTLAEEASITVHGVPAIDVLDTSVANKLKIFGDIIASGDGGEGIHVEGVNTKIVLGAEAEIDADAGIDAAAAGLRVVNKGEIDGLLYGISNSASSTIRNLGDISGDSAISLLGSSKVINGEDGIIQGDFAGVIMTFGSNAKLVNAGMISGNDYAIRMVTGGENSLVNTGTIHGDILFGIGDDVLDSRKGTIEGTIIGGDGDDVFMIGKNQVGIIEDNDSGVDTVHANRTHTLGDNIENLFLQGKRTSDATGNDEDNILMGNKGQNTLRGAEGDDEIGGGAGDDVLFGDDGADVFVFSKGNDHDSIGDFTKGDDTISLVGFEGIESFGDLASKMFRYDNDVWIQLGNGDKLMIQNIDVGDLDASDFSFAA